MAVALALMGDAFMYAVLPSHTVAFGVPLAAVGLLLSANRWIRLLTNPFAGWAFERWGRPRPFAAAVALAVVTTGTYGAGTGVAVLLAARVLWGVCWSFLRLGVYLAAMEAAPPARGRLIGLSWGVVRFGSLIGLLGGGYLADRLGHRAAALFLAGATTLGIAVAWPAVRAARTGRSPTAKAGALFHEGAPDGGENADHSGDCGARCGTVGHGRNGTGKGSRAGGRGNEGGGGRSDQRPASADAGIGGPVAAAHRETPRDRGGTPGETPPARLGAVAYAALVKSLVVEGLVGATLGRLLIDRFGGGVPLAGQTLGVATVTGALLALNDGVGLALGASVGHQVDRLGRRHVLRVAALAAAAALAGLALARSLPLIAVSVAALWVAGVALNVSLAAAAGDVGGAGSMSRVMSRFATWVDIGAASGPLLGYLAVAKFGFPLPYLVGVLVLVSVTAISPWVPAGQWSAHRRERPARAAR
ncbi:MAG: MFS transporter [Armatimonadetes bacterium]|nr:MFS transporter [Armatimonadota bacterium]